MNKQFVFSSFIERIIDKGYYEMIDAAESEAHTAESISSGIKGCIKNREAGSPQYIQKLKRFLFFLKHISMPHGADMFDISFYKKVTKVLIEKGDLKESAFDVFKE